MTGLTRFHHMRRGHTSLYMYTEIYTHMYTYTCTYKYVNYTLMHYAISYCIISNKIQSLVALQKDLIE